MSVFKRERCEIDRWLALFELNINNKAKLTVSANASCHCYKDPTNNKL